MNNTPTNRIQRFEDLIIWQKAVDLAVDIYSLTNSPAFRTDFGMRDQLQRAAVSISTNIAEGFERRSRKEYLNFLNIAKGSAGEVRSLLHVAGRIGLVSVTHAELRRESAKFVSGSIANHMKAISRSKG